MPDRIDVRDAGRERLPPGQIITQKWPVLHYGTVPRVDLATWRFEVSGAVERPVSLSWDELLALPRRETACDMHCVTRWSRYDNVFEGVPVQEVLARAGVKPGAAYVLVHAEQNYTTNLPLSDLDRPANLLALSHNGEPLTPEHGGPVRLLVPHLYLWKSAKWVTGFQLLEEDYPGFWEQNGYHMRGDPWREERYGRPAGPRCGVAEEALRPGDGLGAGQFNSFESCFWRPTRFSCLAWQNRPDVRRQRRRRTNGSPTSCARRTAGRGRLHGPSRRPSAPSASGSPRWSPTSDTTWRRCPSRRRASAAPC